MQILTNPSDSTPAAAGPRWVLLPQRRRHDDRDSSADPKTTAASCTSTGKRFSVSFSVAVPPAETRFHVDWEGSEVVCPASVGDDDDGSYCTYAVAGRKNSKDPQLKIIAVHDDAVLIEMMPHQSGSCSEYFLYESGAGRRPPSLSLLPGCYVSMQYQRDKHARHVPTATPKPRNLSIWNDTGVLRRSEGEFLVAELEMPLLSGVPCDTSELCVLYAGDHDWVLKRVPIVHHEGYGDWRRWSEVDAVVPVGSSFLCWVDYTSSFLVCNLVEEKPKVRHVPLPVLTPKTSRQTSDRLYLSYCRNLAATVSGAVRFVSVAPRSCCGGAGTTTCEHSSSAFNVTAWTLALRMEEPMAWVKDGVLDCDEIWQLPNYGCLPRVALEFPIVCSDNADIVCFMVYEDYESIDGEHGESVWMVQINMRTKELMSVVRNDKEDFSAIDLLPAKLHW